MESKKVRYYTRVDFALENLRLLVPTVDNHEENVFCLVVNS